MKCKWCGVEVVFVPDRELGGGMVFEKETRQLHSCKPFLEWEKSIGLNGPSLSYARYQLWLMGPKKAKARIDLQDKARKPLLPPDFFKTAHVVRGNKTQDAHGSNKEEVRK